MFLFAFHVGIEQRRIPFAPAPEHVTRAVEIMRDLDGLLHLRRGKGKHVGIATRRRAVDVTRIGKEIGGAPEQLDAGALLFFFEHFDHGVEILVGFAEALAPRDAMSRSWKQ